MTEHPLTDEICDQIQDSVHPCDPADMRAAADWQLGQVKEEVKRRLRVWRKSGYSAGADAAEDFFEEVIQQMRPQEDNNG